MNAKPMSGLGLEARVQRLFLAQGLFAERHLYPSAAHDYKMLATDIDVLISEYTSGFHVIKRHVECKGGKPKILDRILWLNGVRTLLHADSSYLVVRDLDIATSEFAQSLDIQTMTLKQLEDWEDSLSIPRDVWPCRSNYQVYDSVKTSWSKMSSSGKPDVSAHLRRELLRFIEIDSWLDFKYRHLNKLLRYILQISKHYKQIGRDQNLKLYYRYLFSALLVRFSQYILAICKDVLRLPATELKSYIEVRLTYGDQNPERAIKLIDGTTSWIKQALQERGMTMPPEIDLGRLYSAPPYAPAFYELVKKVLQQSNDARYLPIAMEVSQFSTPETINQFALLKAASDSGENLSVIVRGFIARTFSVHKDLILPISDDLKTKSGGKTNHSTSVHSESQVQLSLES